MTKRSPFRYFKTSPEIIRLAVMLYIRFPLSLRNVKDLLHERGIEISHETVRYWWNRFGPMFAADLWRTGVGYAAVPTYANATEVRVSPCRGPQPLSDRAPPSKPRAFQAVPRRCARRVARTSCGMISGMGGETETGSL
jgi:putative transposase